MSDALERLKPVCSKDEMRVKLHTPFAIQMAGKRWACATSGHAAAAVLFDGPLREDGPDVPAVVPKRWEPSSRVTREALLAWAGAPAEAECEECDGAGEIDHDCDCEHCHYSGADRCGDCGGTGKAAPDERPAHLFGCVLNRNLLWAVLQSAPDGVLLVQEGTAADPYVLKAASGDWFALVMPFAKNSQTYANAEKLPPPALESA